MTNLAFTKTLAAALIGSVLAASAVSAQNMSAKQAQFQNRLATEATPGARHGGGASNRLAPGKSSNAIPYPSCPQGWSLKQRGAHIYTCYTDTIGMYVPQEETYALGFDCNPNAYWQHGPTTSVQPTANSNPNGPSLYRVRWTCRHN